MAEAPKAFVSYSHDSRDHRRWVLELSTKLVANGIDVTLDQWDLRLGEDVARFMEAGVRESDRVLVICTPQYVMKANEGTGGVGYERLIVTAHLVRDLGTRKFIPIVRDASGEANVPDFLGNRYYVDFSDEGEFNDRFDELLHELHQVPVVQKPPLGRTPFSSLPSGAEAPPSSRPVVPLPGVLDSAQSAVSSYRSAIELARGSDRAGWRQLIKRIQPSVINNLLKWRKEDLDGRRPSDEDLHPAVDEAIGIVSPLVCVAMAGVESGRQGFREQTSLLDDLLYIPGWDRSGYTDWVEMPQALGFIYHSLHGAVAVCTGQINTALSLARHKVAPEDRLVYEEVWQSSSLMGWTRSLGQACTSAWTYLSSAYERWEWLSDIFADELEYRVSLSAYYAGLSIHNLASLIASGSPKKEFAAHDIRVPLTFLGESEEINRRAISFLARSTEEAKAIWTSVGVSREEIGASWEGWIGLCEGWARNVFRRPFYRGELVYQQFLEAFPAD